MLSGEVDEMMAQVLGPEGSQERNHLTARDDHRMHDASFAQTAASASVLLGADAAAGMIKNEPLKTQENVDRYQETLEAFKNLNTYFGRVGEYDIYLRDLTGLADDSIHGLWFTYVGRGSKEGKNGWRQYQGDDDHGWIKQLINRPRLAVMNEEDVA